MAVDTRDKRMSMIGLAKPFVRLLKNPAGSVDAAARAMLLFLYRGIGLAPPAVATPRVAANTTTWSTADTVLSWSLDQTITTLDSY